MEQIRGSLTRKTGKRGRHTFCRGLRSRKGIQTLILILQRWRRNRRCGSRIGFNRRLLLLLCGTKDQRRAPRRNQRHRHDYAGYRSSHHHPRLLTVIRVFGCVFVASLNYN